MAVYSEGRAPEDLWDLTIDDLLVPSAAGPRPVVPSPYVIDLCAANAPLRVPPKEWLNFDRVFVYQVTRLQDDRTTFRLRLGPIGSELEADAILAAVRQDYPSARVSAAYEDDLRAIEAARDGRTPQSIGELVNRVDAELPVATATPATPVPIAPIATNAQRPMAPILTSAAAIPAMTAKSGERQLPFTRDPQRALDSTQTLRVITRRELADKRQPACFVIQLAVAEAAFRPEEVLNLDIFNEFNLYSTIGFEQGRVLHALRLGFFTEESAAEAVAGYLRGYFEASAVRRVGTAERERFAEARVAARKISEATGVHEVIELRSLPVAPTTTLADLSKSAASRESDRPLPSPPFLSPRKR